MPYVCDNSWLGWTADDEPLPPKVSDFMYLPAKEVGGPAGPAKLLIPSESEPGSSDEFENPQEARALHMALKAAGVAKVYCQYDGGNDEGFAWVYQAELDTGERLDTAALAARLIANGLSVRKRMPWQKQWPVELIVEEMLDFPLAVNWAAALLGGRGFGTGNYSMYGGFIADLVLETITDDPSALPVVRDIEIEGVECAPNRFDLAMKRYESANLADPTVSSYRIGDRVVHTEVGSGTVVHVDRNVLTVAFDSGKTVRVVDSYIDRE